MSSRDYSITVSEAARLSGASRGHLMRIVCQGKLKSNLVAGVRLIERRAFEDWLKDYRIRKAAGAIRKGASQASTGPVLTGTQSGSEAANG